MEENKLPPLWKHQKEAVDKASERFALFFDPGCGKSRTVIEIAKKTDNINVIIFTPLNVCRNWANEIAIYFDKPCKVFLMAGQNKAQKLKIIEEFNHEINCKFLICNIETLRSSEYRDLIVASGSNFLIIDESHNFKTSSSLQTKGLLEVVKKLNPTYLYLLSGTPAPQGEMDLWSTFYLLNKTKDNFFIWRKKYFEDLNMRRRGMNSYWPNYSIKQKSKEYFQELLKSCSISAKKDEVLDLPSMLYTNIYTELSPEQKNHYDTMKEFLFAVDEDGNELNAANLLSRTLRLQQIIAGFLGDVPVRDNPRMVALDYAIEKTNGEQFLIWTIFKATYQQIADKLSQKDISFGFLTGEQTAAERQDYMDAFQNGDLRALIAHPKAGGVGVNLTAASFSIHYTRSFSLVDDLQAEARNYRGGSERHKRIVRMDVIAADTIDEEIAEALRKKKSAQEFILGLKQKRKEELNGREAA